MKKYEVWGKEWGWARGYSDIKSEKGVPEAGGYLGEGEEVRKRNSKPNLFEKCHNEPIFLYDSRTTLN